MRFDELAAVRFDIVKNSVYFSMTDQRRTVSLVSDVANALDNNRLNDQHAITSSRDILRRAGKHASKNMPNDEEWGLSALAADRFDGIRRGQTHTFKEYTTQFILTCNSTSAALQRSGSIIRRHAFLKIPGGNPNILNSILRCQTKFRQKVF
jgi:hypothetical protein